MATAGVLFAHYYATCAPTGYFPPLLTNDGNPTDLGKLMGAVHGILHGAEIAEKY